MNYKQLIKDKVKELQDDPNKRTIDVKIDDIKNLKVDQLKVLYNKIIIHISRKIIPCRFKNWLVKTTGVNLGYDVCLPNDIIFDPYFPELIVVEDGVLIGAPNNILSHKYKDGVLTIGKILFKRRALVGAFSTVNPGSIVNEESILNATSVLDGEEIPEGELWAGRPAQIYKKFTKEDIDTYFKPSDGNYKKYYKEAREKIKAFQKNKNDFLLKMHYNGKRLNAGDDWWRARSLFRIFYNGILIELTRPMGDTYLKKLLLKMVGIKIGKNVVIEKNVVFDHIYGDMTTLEDGVKLREHCEIGGHEYTITQTSFGRVLLRKNVEIKEHAFVRAGTEIGENTIIEPYSMSQRQIPANEVWGGIPATRIKKLK